MAIKRSDLEVASYWYADLYRFDVSQRLVDSFGGVPSIEIVGSKQEYINGVMNRLGQSLYNISNFTKEVSINDFNPPDNKFKAFKTSVETVKYLPYTVPYAELVTIAKNPALQEAFTQGRHKAAQNTIDLHIFTEKMKCLLSIQNTYFPSNSAAWYYDHETAWTGDITTSNAGSRVETIRKYVDRLATPSISHIAPGGEFNSAKEEANWYYSSGAKEGYSEHLVMLLDVSFNQKTKTLFSTLLNHDDAMVKIKKVVVDFSLIPGFTSNTTVVKKKKTGTTAAGNGTVKKNKIDAIILDTRAFELGLWIDKVVGTVVLPKKKILFEHMFGYTWNRIRLFPIAVFGRT